MQTYVARSLHQSDPSQSLQKMTTSEGQSCYWNFAATRAELRTDTSTLNRLNKSDVRLNQPFSDAMTTNLRTVLAGALRVPGFGG